MTTFTCLQCEERMSDYLEDALRASERDTMDRHMTSCRQCTELLAGMSEVMEWGRSFPVHEPPAWLPSRIVANTPRVQRETWLDTLSAIGRWLIEPRTAMGLLTTVLMVGWIGSAAGISPDVSAIMQHPTEILDNAGDLLNRAYDGAVRSFYRAPLVTEIQSQIERIREIS